MKYKLTLSPEAAAIILDLYEAGKLEDVGISGVKPSTDVGQRIGTEAERPAEIREPDRPEDLVPRDPIVTIMGHVNHGKTTLLDKIRSIDLAASEGGLPPQIRRAWRVEHIARRVTLLDLPVDKTFTMMRGPRANLIDIAIIVVAVDEGVMPQTEEAIGRAEATGVPIVVALSKIDLPTASLRRTEQQLYDMKVFPDNMGGVVPFVHINAITGEGIDELLDNLSVIADLHELKANPNKPASGICLEAHADEKEGILATLLVRDGTLGIGNAVICGTAYGRVSAIYDERGRTIRKAGPSAPVRIAGLDSIPTADDIFHVAPYLATARQMARRRKLCE